MKTTYTIALALLAWSVPAFSQDVDDVAKEVEGLTYAIQSLLDSQLNSDGELMRECIAYEKSQARNCRREETQRRGVGPPKTQPRLFDARPPIPRT
jgi:hypothetical protein